MNGMINYHDIVTDYAVTDCDHLKMLSGDSVTHSDFHVVDDDDVSSAAEYENDDADVADVAAAGDGDDDECVVDADVAVAVSTVEQAAAISHNSEALTMDAEADVVHLK